MFGKSLESRRSYWAYAFARLKPGVSAEQAAASINVALCGDRQRRRSAAPEGHERPDDEAVPRAQGDRATGPARTEPPAPERADPARAADVGHRARAADRLREHREPAAGTGRRPIGRNGRAALDRREPVAAGSPAARRGGPAGGLWRRAGSARRQVDARSHHLACPGRSGTLRLGIDRRPGRPVRRRGRRGDGPAVRTLSGAPQHEAEPRQRAQGAAGPAGWRAFGGVVPQRARDGAGRAVDAAAGGRRPVREEPLQREPRRVGREGGPHRHLWRLSATEWLHGRRDPSSCSNGSRTNWARCPASPA